jgi:hypothetical protein
MQMIIIAISQPIEILEPEKHAIFYNTSMYMQQKLRDKFYYSGKQIDYKFEVLHDTFFETYTSCKVLHIKPVMFNYIDTNHILNIEDEYFT